MLDTDCIAIRCNTMCSKQSCTAVTALTVHASIAKAASKVAVALSVRSASPYVSMMLSADNDVLAVELAVSEPLQITSKELAA